MVTDLYYSIILIIYRMEAPLKIHMSTNIATALDNSNEDQLSSGSFSSLEVGSSLLRPHFDDLSKTTIKEENLSDDKRTASRLIFPYISCLPQDSAFFCFILSVWDNIVGPQTVYVWKKNKVSSVDTVSKHVFRSRSKSSSDDSQFLLPNASEDAISLPSSLSTYEDCKLSHGGDIKESSDIICSTYCELQDCTDLNPSTSSSKLMSKVLYSHDDGFSSITAKELNLLSVVKYVTEHSVGVAVSSTAVSNKMIFHLLMSPSQNITVLSIKFLVNENGVGVPYSVSAVIPKENESLVLPALNLCSDALLRITAKVRLLITKEGIKSGNKVQDSLIELCKTLSSLRDGGLIQYPIENFCCKPDDRRMAERMLTSHLQTMGVTLVIADSPSEANKVVMWLAQFLSEDELSVSRIALSDYQWPYQPGITIQAVIRDSSGEVDLSSAKLLCSRYPVTLIDLTTNTVRQMGNVNEHSKNSEATLRQQLLALWHDLDHVPAPSHSLFENVEVSSSMVKRFLHEWDRLASCELFVRQKYLKSFLRSLQYYALSILVWTRHEWTAERRRREQKSLLQTLSATFLLEDADLKVILAQVELIQPGFMSLVLE